MVVAALGAVPSAGASTVMPAKWADTGPVLSGGDSVWTEQERTDQSVYGDLSVHIAPPGGPARTLLTVPTPPGHAQFVEDLAASERRIALIRRPAHPTSEGCCFTSNGMELLVGGPAGGFQTLERSSDGWRCTPASADLDGDLLAIVRTNCPGRDIVIRDLAAGGEERAIPWAADGLYPGMQPRIELAGRYVAWHARRSVSGGGATIIVYDRLANREAYRAEISPFLVGAPSNYQVQLDIDRDGTLVAALPNYLNVQGPPRLTWFSVADPQPHVLPVTAESTALSIDGGLVALRRADHDDYAVVKLDGSAVNVFDYNGRGYGDIDFDGRRLTWVQGDGIHNEPFPVVATPDLRSRRLSVAPSGAVALPVWCPTSGARCAGAASLQRSTSGAGTGMTARATGSRRFRIPAGRTRSVRLSLSRTARRELTRRGRLRMRAVVSSRGRRSSEQVTLVRRRARR